MAKEQQLSDMEQELYDAQHGFFNNEITEDTMMGEEDLDEFNEALDETQHDADALMEEINTSAQEAKNNLPDTQYKAEQESIIEDAQGQAKDYHDELSNNITKTKNQIKECKANLKDLKRQQRLETLSKVTASARDKFFTFGEACVKGFKKMAELGKEATINLRAAATAAKKTEIANNLQAGFRGVAHEISQVRLSVHEQRRDSLNQELAEVKRQYKNEIRKIDKKVEEKAKKQINSPIHRMMLGFSREGRERLRNPVLDLKLEMEKVKKNLIFQQQYQYVEEKYNANYSKGDKVLSMGLAKDGKITQILKALEKEQNAINKAHDRTARFMDKVEHEREKKSFGELFKDEKNKIEKTYENKRTGTQIRENDLKDKDKIDGNKTVEKTSKSKDDEIR